jgi:hypothetical protein
MVFVLTESALVGRAHGKHEMNKAVEPLTPFIAQYVVNFGYTYSDSKTKHLMILCNVLIFLYLNHK